MRLVAWVLLVFAIWRIEKLILLKSFCHLSGNKPNNVSKLQSAMVFVMKWHVQAYVIMGMCVGVSVGVDGRVSPREWWFVWWMCFVFAMVWQVNGKGANPFPYHCRPRATSMVEINQNLTLYTNNGYLDPNRLVRMITQTSHNTYIARRVHTRLSQAHTKLHESNLDLHRPQDSKRNTDIDAACQTKSNEPNTCMSAAPCQWRPRAAQGGSCSPR